METTKCRRCRSEKEHIPTHQYVKFDEEVSYLCHACWDLFRKWYFCSPRPIPATHTHR